MEVNQFLDATYLKTALQANISEEENLNRVRQLLEEAIQFDYKLVMIRSKYIAFAKDFLKQNNSNTLVGTVIGFHEGTYSLDDKLLEARNAIDLQADELDFVINYDAFKRGCVAMIKEEVLMCSKLAIANAKVVKWIIETAALDTKEIIAIINLIKGIVLKNFHKNDLEKVFIKSSTGFYTTENNIPNGATLEIMKLISEHARPLKVKAAGGVRDYGTALKMIALGVDRIGTSSAREICTKQKNNFNLAY